MCGCRLARLRALALAVALVLGGGGEAGAREASGAPSEPEAAANAAERPSPEPGDEADSGPPPEPEAAANAAERPPPEPGDEADSGPPPEPEAAANAAERPPPEPGDEADSGPPPPGPGDDTSAALEGEAGDDTVAALEAYDPLFDEPEEVPSGLDVDPLEGANRHVFAFNRQLDRWVLTPVIDGYRFVVPGPVRRSVHRVMQNVNAPVVFANQVLQLRPRAAATTVGRFTANTTLGVAGVFDFADEVMGLEPTDADFGQTLSRYGVPHGAYLMFPVLGPTTARDAVGSVVDYFLDPITYLIGPLNLEWQMIVGGGEGLATYDARGEGLDALRRSSVDFYAAMRSAYLQSRHAAEIEARSESCAARRDDAPVPVADAQASEEPAP